MIDAVDRLLGRRVSVAVVVWVGAAGIHVPCCGGEPAEGVVQRVASNGQSDVELITLGVEGRQMCAAIQVTTPAHARTTEFLYSLRCQLRCVA